METTQCLQNKTKIILVGDKVGKRTEYFTSAAHLMGYSVTCVGWNELREQDLALSAFAKLDPPGMLGAEIETLPSFADWYCNQLQNIDLKKGIQFLNTPQAIIQTFDKGFCKTRLEECGVHITKMLTDTVSNYDEFRDVLAAKNARSVFIKPRFGSGAAGIIAYRYHPPTGQEIIYTSMSQNESGTLYNTKKMMKLNEHKLIKKMINELLKQSVIVETWVQKAQINGWNFDLRVVYQYGTMDFIVARGSKSPITNLHLNNGAIPVDSIGLINNQLDVLEALCHKTMACFDGLNIAGIDVLVTPKGTLKVIEVNGQGDLIYQDIFHENLIYQRQIREGMKPYE